MNFWLNFGTHIVHGDTLKSNLVIKAADYFWLLWSGLETLLL